MAALCIIRKDDRKIKTGGSVVDSLKMVQESAKLTLRIKLPRSHDSPGKADVMVAGVKTGGQSTRF